MRDANDPEHDNRVRWDRDDPRGHVESHFLRVTSPDARRAVWVKHTLLAPRGRAALGVSELWIVAFDLDGRNAGAKTSIPAARARFSERPFRIESGDAVFETGHVAGVAESGGHRLEADLSFDVGGRSFHLLPIEAFYEGRFPKLKALTPYPDTAFRGHVVVDGERWEIDGWPGMQGHNWGAGHADLYVWANANAWDAGADGPAWFEAGVNRLRYGPVTTPWMGSAAIAIGGELRHFGGPRAILSQAVDLEYYRLRYAVRQGRASLRVDVEADREGIAGLHYENPDGSMTYCLNSKLARGKVVLTEPGRPDRVLETGRMALEIGTRDPHHGATMVV